MKKAKKIRKNYVFKIDNRDIINQLKDIINNGGNIWKKYKF